MVNRSNQLGMFDTKTLVLDLPDAEVTYTRPFYSAAEATVLYQQILDETSWRQETVRVYGKSYLTPRLSCWMGDLGLDYRYSNMTMVPRPWSATLMGVKTRIEEHCGVVFNSVLINYYRDGQDSNGWHSDDEPELKKDPVIASLSLGAVRDFHLRHKKNRQKATIALEHGSLLMMSGATQRCWQHHVPKRAISDGRINLTFRTIHQV